MELADLRETARSKPGDSSVYERLRLLILDGQIGLGEPLVERTLAARLGVSRTPVREAILRLGREGLVRIFEGRGAFVQAYSVEDVVEIYNLREALEALAARLACPNIPDSSLDLFEQRLLRFREDPARRASEPLLWRKVGRGFHQMFVHASRSPRLVEMLALLHDQIELVRGIGRTVSRDAGHRSTVEEHLEILAGFRARDPDRAEKAVRIHLRNGLAYRLEGLQTLR
jgi:DNA-binding GntR family transcriptional regulator